MNQKILKKFLISGAIIFIVISILGFRYVSQQGLRSAALTESTRPEITTSAEVTTTTSAEVTTLEMSKEATEATSAEVSEDIRPQVTTARATIVEETTVEETTKIIVEETTETTIEETIETTVEETTEATQTKGAGITDYERRLLAGLVYLEGRGEPYETQKMIVSVILNRSYMYNMSIESVIYQPGQFSIASSIMNITHEQMQYDAVDEVLMNGVILPHYVLYFRAGYFHEWSGHAPYIQSGNTYFSYNISDK